MLLKALIVALKLAVMTIVTIFVKITKKAIRTMIVTIVRLKSD